MSSTGYGDIHAHNTTSQLIAIMVMLTGLLLYGYCLSSITATLANSAAPKYANNISVYISYVSHSRHDAANDTQFCVVRLRSGFSGRKCAFN